MPSVTETRQDAKQVIAEFARNLAVLLEYLDDLPGTRLTSSRHRDELALIARLKSLADAPAPKITPDTRHLLHEAFTLARIRCQRMVRHVRGNPLQHLGEWLRAVLSRHSQPTGGDTTPSSERTAAQLAPALLRELDEKRRELNDYLDHYQDNPGTPAGNPGTSAVQARTGARTTRPQAGPAKVPASKAASTNTPRQQKLNRGSPRSKPRPNIAKRA